MKKKSLLISTETDKNSADFQKMLKTIAKQHELRAPSSDHYFIFQVLNKISSAYVVKFL